MFTRGQNKLKDNRSNGEQNSTIVSQAVDETRLVVTQIRKWVPQYKITILLESELDDSKEDARPVMRYNFNQEDIIKRGEGYYDKINNDNA